MTLSIEELKEMRSEYGIYTVAAALDELIAIRELKGDQVPRVNPVLAYADSYRDMAKQGSDSVPIWGVITDLERNIAPLFTAQQKPVLHPQLLSDIRQCVIDATAWCTHRSPPDYVINVNAWLAVGGIVKVTDKCHPSLMESVTVPHNVIGSYEDASGGRSDIVTLSDKREMKDMSSIVKDGE